MNRQDQLARTDIEIPADVRLVSDFHMPTIPPLKKEDAGGGCVGVLGFVLVFVFVTWASYHLICWLK